MTVREKNDNLVRAMNSDASARVRSKDEGGTGRTMFGHAAVFNRWTEIDSWYEGQFLERIAPGAFEQTLRDDASQIRIMYAHGRDPFIGARSIGAPNILREDETGLYYESELYDTLAGNEVLPLLRDGQLGASFRMQVLDESSALPRSASDYNPGRLEERTINRVRLLELGPCPWGAYQDATAGVRSATDDFLESMMNDPVFVARFAAQRGPLLVEKIIAQASADGHARATANKEPADGGMEKAPQRGIPLALARDQGHALLLG